MMTTTIDGKAMLRPDDVMRLLNIGRSTLLTWTKTGQFPRPAIQKTRYTAWRAADVEKWIQEQQG